MLSLKACKVVMVQVIQRQHYQMHPGMRMKYGRGIQFVETVPEKFRLNTGYF